jgi:mono/diheme cytochrome c family protein
MQRQPRAAVGIAFAAGLAAAVFGAVAGPPPAKSPEFFDGTLRPFVKRYCLGCHSGEDAEHGIQLDKYRTAAAVTEDRATWQKVQGMLRSQKMPPKGGRRPKAEEYDAVVAWLETVLGRAEGTGPTDPGRVTIRRLNRAEYSNTVRDLLGVEFNAAADFPSDDVGYGFDNIGDVLTLPPLLMEKYLAAAEQIAAKAIVTDKPGTKFEDPPEPHRRVFFVRPGDTLPPEAAAKQILRPLATRAYRRPANDREVDRLAKLVTTATAQGDSFEAGVRLALQAILVSPHFLFRVEIDPQPGGAAAIRELSDYELAARLSYFLWSSMPDDELFDLAARGKLRADLDRQVRRMLRDPKAKAMVENFAGQWLQLRNLDNAAPDRMQFPAFDDTLRLAMRTESEMFFETIVREDRSVLELIDADFTFVNGPLAKHYGLMGIEGDQFRRVSLPVTGGPKGVQGRGGVITQAAVLTVTSNPTRTSPVKRGKWVLQNILGTPPPDPPPNVPMLKDDAKAASTGTLRQRMEQHRKDPNCAVCHKEMDAMGFALENFDAVGAWRTSDGKFPIDAAAQLPDGRSFNGPRELKALLRSNKDQFARCLAEELLIYGLGRGLEPFDKPAVDGIAKSLAAGDYKFSTLVLGIVHSDPFLKRHGGVALAEPVARSTKKE